MYTIAQAKSLTKEQITEFANNIHLFEFTTEEAHLDLLAEVRTRMYFGVLPVGSCRVQEDSKQTYLVAAQKHQFTKAFAKEAS